jgi:hypothetical protein
VSAAAKREDGPLVIDPEANKTGDQINREALPAPSAVGCGRLYCSGTAEKFASDHATIGAFGEP